VNTQDILTRAQDAMTARRVFGDPIEAGGTTIVPAATIRGGGGGGQKGGGNAGGDGDGGAGFGLAAKPAGVYVIRDGEVEWRPAVNPNLIALGGQIVGLAAILTTGAVLLAWLSRRD